jgi:cation diffusion facilitator CzcD-associated flavoprotein CzcO
MNSVLKRFADDSENNEVTRVVIIGGGAAGLSALGALQRRKNFEVVLIEKEAHIGGVWYLCDYPGLSIHARSFSFKFYNFHSPPSATQHATRNEILSYLDSYVAHFHLEDRIVLQRQVVKITYHESGDVVHKCHVEVEDPRSRARDVLRCDYVICALGFTNAGTPQMPEFHTNGAGFKGRVLHSSQFNEALLTKIRTQHANVCLLGAGKSAYDIALQFTKHGMWDNTTWVYK